MEKEKRDAYAQTLQVHCRVDRHVDVDVTVCFVLYLLRFVTRLVLENGIPHMPLAITFPLGINVAPRLVAQEAEEREEVVDCVLQGRAADHPVDGSAQRHDGLVNKSPAMKIKAKPNLSFLMMWPSSIMIRFHSVSYSQFSCPFSRVKAATQESYVVNTTPYPFMEVTRPGLRSIATS